MPGYKYDIFLSYKRHPETRTWLIDHFRPVLEHYVGLELGREPKVFFDEHSHEVGGTWPLDLGLALGESRVLVALWTKNYFHSEWCSRELATMLGREQEEKLRTVARPRGVVVPVILHDCNALPPELSQIGYAAFHKYYVTRMNRNSDLAESLTVKIAELARFVAHAIEEAPEWREAWPAEAAQSFHEALLRKQPPQQIQVPGRGP